MEVEEMLKRLVLAIALGALAAVPMAHAGATIGGAGPRVGVSIDPDQFVFGGQLIIGELAPDLTFDPSLEFGFGDNVTVIAMNLDMHYHFTVEGSAWRPYAGAGLGLAFIEVDEGGGSDTEVGLNLVGGAGVPTQSGNRFFGELRLGLGDIPEVKLIAGWNFKI
jgi:hypothetical protein